MTVTSSSAASPFRRGRGRGQTRLEVVVATGGAAGGAAGGGDRPGTPAERGAQRLVSRRALFQRLSAGGSGGVTLVAAPPGSGKTALLRSWVEGAGLRDRVAW